MRARCDGNNVRNAAHRGGALGEGGGGPGVGLSGDSERGGGACEAGLGYSGWCAVGGRGAVCFGLRIC